MPDFGLTIKVTEGSNDGPPVPHATVYGIMENQTTDATGTAVLERIYISVSADGFLPYVHQPYERPSLQAPITVSLQRRTASA
jgi:hypothetical protein